MAKTRVDDMLIEMITPRVREIEERFGRGEGLSQEDINTLLLKSQYNHINHLDAKLDEITASVLALEHRFDNRFAELEGKFTALEGKFTAFKAEMIAEFERRMGALETEFERRMGALETEIERRMGALEMKFAQLETKFAQLETKFEKAQNDMREALIVTMRWYIGGAGIVIVLLKALDLFVK